MKESAHTQDLHTNQSPVHKLPHELLRNIFILSCNESENFVTSDEAPFSFTLTTVSSYWRNITLSMQPLWSSIHLDFQKLSMTSPNRLKLSNVKRVVNMFLQRSETYPLDIILITSNRLVYAEEIDIIKSLLAHCHRWDAAIIRGCVRLFRSFLFDKFRAPLGIAFPLLTQLVIDQCPESSYDTPTEDISERDILFQSPLLKEFTWFQRISPSQGVHVKVNASSVKSLTLSTYCLPFYYTHTIQHFNNLESLDLSIESLEDIRSLTELYIPCQNLYLRFHLFRDEMPKLSLFFDALVLPRISNLTIHVGPRTKRSDPRDLFPINSLINALASRISCLISLDLSICAYEDSLITLLEQTSSLESLSLYAFAAGTKHLIGNRLMHLMCPMMHGTVVGGDSDCFLPKLKDLAITWEHPSFDFDLLIEMIKSRLPASISDAAIGEGMAIRDLPVESGKMLGPVSMLRSLYLSSYHLKREDVEILNSFTELGMDVEVKDYLVTV